MKRFVVLGCIVTFCCAFSFSNLFLPEKHRQIPFNKADWDAGINRCVMILDIQENKIRQYMHKKDVEALLGKPSVEGAGCIAYPSNSECFFSYHTPSSSPFYLRVCFSGDAVSSKPKFVVIKTQEYKQKSLCSVLSEERCEELKKNF